MKTFTKQRYGLMERARKEYTYQAEFPPTVDCSFCPGTAKLMCLVDDDEGHIEYARPRGYKGIWPHDQMAMANYMCAKCGEISTEWNQG
ncbi:hypothetical protein LCGC14_0971180 [marine sediment metagenome]|uniref:Uncharacterized protein n=1 Tax=marine sediment metagenome TaxID=412755 RepID=A0A0F9RI15_9ZZZZ